MSQSGIVSKRLNVILVVIFGIEARFGLSYTTLCCTGIGIPNSEIRLLLSENLFLTLTFLLFRHGTSTVASLSNWARTFVYNTLTVTQSIARFSPRQADCVDRQHYIVWTWRAFVKSSASSMPIEATMTLWSEYRWEKWVGRMTIYQTWARTKK